MASHIRRASAYAIACAAAFAMMLEPSRPVVGADPSPAALPQNESQFKRVFPRRPPNPYPETLRPSAPSSPARTRIVRRHTADLVPGWFLFTHRQQLVVAPAADPRDDAYPMFNARSCAECHRQADVGGGGPNENNVRLVDLTQAGNAPEFARHFRSDKGVAVLHRQSLASQYAKWRLAFIERLSPHDPEVFDLEKIRRELASAPKELVIACGCGMRSPSPFDERNTPPLFGLGRLESIPQSAVDAVAASQPKEVRGRSPRLKGGGHGRFGWKASTATLAAFNENACAVELGLSTPRFTPKLFRPLGHAPLSTTSAARPDPLPNPTPDMSKQDLAELTRFVAALPSPRQWPAPHPQSLAAQGERNFRAVGCATCHVPDLGGVTGLYSDLLLHSVGTSGGGFYGESFPGEPDVDLAEADEFRTPPLWGVADSAPYLHDGSAATLEAAILAHSRQATSSVEAFNRLAEADRKDLLTFLETLRAR